MRRFFRQFLYLLGIIIFATVSVFLFKKGFPILQRAGRPLWQQLNHTPVNRQQMVKDLAMGLTLVALGTLSGALFWNSLQALRRA